MTVTNYDIKLMLQPDIHYELRVEALKDDGKTVLDIIQGTIIGGNSSIDSSSSVRRTFNVTIIPTLYDRNDTKISEENLVWLNKEARLYVCAKNIRTGEYKNYIQGYYVYSNVSSTYDATTNQLTITCSDYMAKLDGTKNGQVGALTTLIPAYEENKVTGEIVKYNIIREAMITILTEMGNINTYYVDDIGEFYAMPQNNTEWESYREMNPYWNTIPYDIELSSGTTVFAILEELLNLYPNYEMYFDENNVFTCKMIPSCDGDKVLFDDTFIQKVLISENRTLDLSTVRNVCEVWGKTIEADFYTEDCKQENDTYICTIDGYDEKYYNGDLIAIRVPETNGDDSKLRINNTNTLLDEIGIFDENTYRRISAGILQSDNVYVFKIKTKRENNATITYCVLLGQWQAHGLNVLTDGTVGEDFVFNDGTIEKKFSKEYFKKKYNCESVEFETIPSSPFVVQKLGEVLDVKTGGEYENITSDALALARAKWENWKNSRLTDNLTITIRYAPFFDVNTKISYQNSYTSYPEEYIIKSVSNDFSSYTTTLSLIKFYPLYQN